MELRQLEYFLAVCDEGSFTRAAQRLHVVQSAVSAAIKNLERELHTVLFVRSSKQMDLTEAGRALLPKARATIDAAVAARDVVAEVRTGLRGTVRVGTMTSVAPIDVPDVVGRFHRAYPGVTLSLRANMTGSAGLAELVVNGGLDLAILSISGGAPAGLQLRSLGSSPLLLVVRDDHRLADRADATLADVADEPFIDFPVGFGNRTIVDRAFREAGRRRRVVVEIADAGEAAAYVRAGLGVSLVPGFVRPRPDGVAVLTISDVDLTWPVQLAQPADRPPSAAASVLAQMMVDAAPPTAV
ncbi:DNA-binding transcriptional regulator, LysR family [Nakamurella panacisegetis]|uniref:DNA-binding transcriptional regulator, LysR family n=1 Tax=Nakamurella panacisegetis TaxID=1090615 RepID=A0A1H0HM21_9ACTN|nr:LysR family transcriptional regulator [Nakamurella panacisegetis]SDO20147.1 DNA-binding transcriptional regulator, LysR family [Nakamurella panacisegetis]